MSKIFELEKNCDNWAGTGDSHPFGVKRELSADYELGLETALILFNQIDCLLASGQELEPFFRSVRYMVQAESLLVLEACGQSEAKVRFGHPDISKTWCRDLSQPEQFCARLARIRYAHFYHPGCPEFVENVHKLKNILAVPVFENGESRGCLAVFNSLNRARFQQRDALLLAVAAAALTLSRF